MANLFIITQLIPFILFTFSEIQCDNSTNFYHSINSKMFETRQNRLLTFNTQANGDINMELAFNVPFITIPVKKSIGMASGFVANVNIGAIILGGAIAFGFAVLIPGLSLLFSKTMDTQTPQAGYRREEGRWWNFFPDDVETCVQRMVCLSVKSSANNVAKGQSSSSDKIIEGLASSEWLQVIIGGTAIHDAVQDGLTQESCSGKYSGCKFSQDTMQNIAMKMLSIWKN